MNLKEPERREKNSHIILPDCVWEITWMNITYKWKWAAIHFDSMLLSFRELLSEVIFGFVVLPLRHTDSNWIYCVQNLSILKFTLKDVFDYSNSLCWKLINFDHFVIHTQFQSIGFVRNVTKKNKSFLCEKNINLNKMKLENHWVRSCSGYYWMQN